MPKTHFPNPWHKDLPGCRVRRSVNPPLTSVKVSEVNCLNCIADIHKKRFIKDGILDTNAMIEATKRVQQTTIPGHYLG